MTVAASTIRRPAMSDQQWGSIVESATRAPSIHNTQPWRFEAGGNRLDVFYDGDRALPVLDPTGRQQIISCGIAVEFAVIALRAAGSTSEVRVLPDSTDADHLARVSVTGARETTGDDRALAQAIADRHTVRAAFQPRAVPAELLDRMRTAAAGYHTWLKPITDEEEEVATAFLLSRAEDLEQGDPAYLAELQRWVRTDPAAVDGVPAAAVSTADPRERASNWLIRDFVAGTREQRAFLPAGNPDAPPPTVERPTVLLLGSENDDRAAWLAAGRALGVLLLVATAAGLAASPLTQALDWPATRHQLRSRLHLLGHPQMLLRLGYPPAELSPVVSGRRSVADVLRRT
jgi:nitroreductase